MFVLIGFKITGSDDNRTGIKRRRNHPYPFRYFVDKKPLRIIISPHRFSHSFHLINFFALRKFYQCHRMCRHVIGNDKLHPCQSYSVIWEFSHFECDIGVTDVHIELRYSRSKIAQIDIGDLIINQPRIHTTALPLSTAHRHFIAIMQHVRRIHRSYDCRNTDLTCYNSGMTCPSSSIGDHSRCFFHDRFPVRIGDVGDKDIAGIKFLTLMRRMDDFYPTGADFFPDCFTTQ